MWLANSHGNCFRYRQLNQKTRADRMIVFRMNRAAMLGNNARGDGQTQPGAAIFGGKLRQEKFVFIFGRNAVTGIGYRNFDGFSLRAIPGGNNNFAARSNAPAIPRHCRSN